MNILLQPPIHAPTVLLVNSVEEGGVIMATTKSTIARFKTNYGKSIKWIFLITYQETRAVINYILFLSFSFFFWLSSRQKNTKTKKQ